MKEVKAETAEEGDLGIVAEVISFLNALYRRKLF